MFHNQAAQNPAHLLQKSTLKTPTLPTYWPLGRLAEIARSLRDRHPRDGEGVEHSTLSEFRDQYARAREAYMKLLGGTGPSPQLMLLWSRR